MKKNKEIFKEYDFSRGRRGAVLPQKGKTRITICIDTDVLEWFRDKAEREGQGYQTSINRALRDYIKQDKRPIQDIVRDVVRQEMRKSKKAS